MVVCDRGVLLDQMFETVICNVFCLGPRPLVVTSGICALPSTYHIEFGPLLLCSRTCRRVVLVCTCTDTTFPLAGVLIHIYRIL